jgi:hypothetical protein
VRILDSDVYIGINWAQDVGTYEFTFADDNADEDSNNCSSTSAEKMKAWYTFIYMYENDKEWKIIHHHSSLMPDDDISDDEQDDSGLVGRQQQQHLQQQQQPPGALAAAAA